MIRIAHKPRFKAAEITAVTPIGVDEMAEVLHRASEMAERGWIMIPSNKVNSSMMVKPVEERESYVYEVVDDTDSLRYPLSIEYSLEEAIDRIDDIIHKNSMPGGEGCKTAIIEIRRRGMGVSGVGEVAHCEELTWSTLAGVDKPNIVSNVLVDGREE